MFFCSSYLLFSPPWSVVSPSDNDSSSLEFDTESESSSIYRDCIVPDFNELSSHICYNGPNFAYSLFSILMVLILLSPYYLKPPKKLYVSYGFSKISGEA